MRCAVASHEIRIALSDEQRAYCDQYARENYRPGLRITWRDVATAWARTGFENMLDRDRGSEIPSHDKA